MVFCVQGALGLAPPEYAERAERLTERLGEMQRADGSWEGTSLFHALDGLLTVRNAPARTVIARAIPRLLTGQTPSGAFDPSGDEELALIALRAIHTQTPGLRPVNRSPHSQAQGQKR